MITKKQREKEKGNDVNRVLSAGISYTLGKYYFLLDEKTGDLKLSVHTNQDSLKITPKSDNSIILHACR